MHSSGISATKETIGLTKLDGKRSERFTLIPWKGGESPRCDVIITVVGYEPVRCEDAVEVIELSRVKRDDGTCSQHLLVSVERRRRPSVGRQ